MAINYQDDYVPLPQAATEMGIAYTTAYQYCTKGLLKGALRHNGTKWLVPKKTIKLFNDGKLIIKGAFRKKN